MDLGRTGLVQDDTGARTKEGKEGESLVDLMTSTVASVVASMASMVSMVAPLRLMTEPKLGEERADGLTHKLDGERAEG